MKLDIRLQKAFGFCRIAIIGWGLCNAHAALPMVEMSFEDLVTPQTEPLTTREIPRLEQPPSLDKAEADAAVWEKASKIALEFPATSGRSTAVKFGFDEDYLYISAVCNVGHGSEIQSEVRIRDSRIWQDDALEIWIQGGANGDDLFQFVVNADGSIFDARKNLADYQSDIKVVTQKVKERGDIFWRAIIAIPRKSLDLAAWPHRLPFNIARDVPGVGQAVWGDEHGGTDQSSLVFAGIAKKEGKAGTSASLKEMVDQFKVEFFRTELRAGERWLDGKVVVSSAEKDLTVKATVIGNAENKVAGVAEAKVTGPEGYFRVNVRDMTGDAGVVRMELFQGANRLAVKETVVTSVEEIPLKAGVRIPVQVDMPEWAGKSKDMTQTAVTFGVPFAAGALWDASGLRLMDVDGKAIPFQQEVSGTWYPDGSIMWLRADALINPAKPCFVVLNEEAKTVAPVTPVQALPVKDGVVELRRGPLRYVIGAAKSPIQQITRDGKTIATAEGARGLYVVDQGGREAVASDKGATVVVESSGPVSACVRVEGDYCADKGEAIAHHITRVELFAGRDAARVTHTFILTQDSNKVWFKEIGWELAVNEGKDGKAFFATSPTDAGVTETVSLASGQEAFMLQKSHFRFMAGKNEFVIGRGKETVRMGEECGDWAALAGDAGGLLMGCRDSAKLHPKEFNIQTGKMNLKLFSPRAGEELDFRSEWLAKKWNLREIAKLGLRNIPSGYVEGAAKIVSDALGWSRTHELVLSPVAPKAVPADMARPLEEAFQPVYALSDPAWLYQTCALGRLHPKDETKFPLQETFVRDLAYAWVAVGVKFGEYGFVDYFTGPHFVHSGGSFPDLEGRWNLSYTLRPDIWYLYARSGDRNLREFAQGTNRTWLDGRMAHWGDNRKMRGLYVWQVGGNPSGVDLPIYWGYRTEWEVASSSDLDMARLDYYLTGYRRAAHILAQYGEGVKASWTPQKADTGRIIREFYNITQAYSLRWDPKLGQIARRVAAMCYDERGDLLLSNERPYSSSYKTHSDLNGLLFGYRVFGDEFLKQMALRLAEFYRDDYGVPISYGNPQGVVDPFLYAQTGDKSLGEAMAIRLRAIGTLTVSPDNLSSMGRISDMGFILRGFAYGEDLVDRTGAWQSPTASWLGWQDYGRLYPIYVQKNRNEKVDIRYVGDDADEFVAGGILTAKALNPTEGSWGLDLHSISTTSRQNAVVHLAFDTQKGIYVIQPLRGAGHFFLANRLVPMVLEAKGFWSPAPGQNPMPPIFFAMAKDAKDAAIFVESGGTLTAPDGRQLGERNSLNGWIALPSGQPGVWRLDLKKSVLISSRGIPPYFGFGSADTFFLPTETGGESDAELVRQALAKPGLDLPTGKQLQIKWNDGAPPSEFAKDGWTIEFDFLPNWDGFGRDTDRTLLSVIGDDGKSTAFNYRSTGGKEANWHTSYNLNFMPAAINSQGNETHIRCYRKHLFVKDEWVHVAVEWGNFKGWAHGESVISTRIFVNGKTGPNSTEQREDAHFAFNPTGFNFSPELDGRIRNLIITNRVKYHDSFELGDIASVDENSIIFPLEKDLNPTSGKLPLHAEIIDAKALKPVIAQ